MSNQKIKLQPQMILYSLEDSLSTMREAINLIYEGDASKIKVVSGILRDLVCYSSNNRGLLWRIKEQFPYNDIIDTPDFASNFASNPRNTKSSFFTVLMDHGIWQTNGPKLEKRSLQDYFQNGIAVRFKLPNSEDSTDLSPVQVIKEAADQIGAHTDQGISETFATLASMKSGETSVLVRLIASFAILTAEIGERAIVAAIALGYQRRKRPIDLPKKSLAHAKIDYDLIVPELDMEDVRHVESILSYRSAKEALSGPLPFPIGRSGKKNLMIDIWVGLPLSIDFSVYIDEIFQGRVSFEYPKGEDSSEIIDIRWNNEKIQVKFGEEVRYLSRASN
jgi:hypothetical protein